MKETKRNLHILKGTVLSGVIPVIDMTVRLKALTKISAIVSSFYLVITIIPFSELLRHINFARFAKILTKILYESNKSHNVFAVFTPADIVIRLQNQNTKVPLIVIYKQLKDIKFHVQTDDFYEETETREYVKAILKEKLSRKKKAFL